MGRASSAKKIQRVQRAGAVTSAATRRNLGYPALVAGVIVVGLVLAFMARNAYRDTVVAQPRVGTDYFRNAVGIYVCDEFLENPSDQQADTTGVHTLGDGLIHINPKATKYAGPNSKWGLFADAVGIEFGKGSFTYQGKTYKDGGTCEVQTTAKDGTTKTEKKKAELVLLRWPAQSSTEAKAERITGNLAGQPLRKDRELWVLKYAPKGTNPGLPPSKEALNNPVEASASTTVPSPATTGPATTAPATTAPATTAPATTAPATTVAGG